MAPTKNTTALAANPLHLVDVDPATLRTADQIRQDATPDDALVDSVRAAGILQPPTVVWNADEDAYFIVFGHRRVGAAIAAGLESISVIVRDRESITEAMTLEQQIVENERRKGITGEELARGWANLEGLFGMTPEDIAGAIGELPERVRAGIRAARSEKTSALLASRPTIDLEKAAVLSDFDDHPKIQFELATIAETRPQDFEWRVRDAHRTVAKESRIAELKAELKQQKVKIAKSDAYGGLSSKAARLTSLVDEKGKKLTPKNHASCPGHAGHVSGWNPEDLKIDYVCSDYAAHGHVYASNAPQELTPEEKQAKADREAQQAAVLANREARRQWIHDLLPGKINQLAGVYDYMAGALLRHDDWNNDGRAPAVTMALLDVDAPDDHYKRRGAMDDLVLSKKIAPFRLMLATALGIHELMLEQGRSAIGRVRHFTQLEKWGYALSEIDQAALAEAQEQLDAAAARLAADAASSTDEAKEDGE